MEHFTSRIPEDVLSNNIEVDCLGKSVPITSPEAPAGFACQTAIRSLSEKLSTEVMQQFLKDGELSMKSEPLMVENYADSIHNLFSQAEGLYAENQNGTISKLMRVVQGVPDTFERRELEFSKLFKDK